MNILNFFCYLSTSPLPSTVTKDCDDYMSEEEEEVEEGADVSKGEKERR